MLKNEHYLKGSCSQNRNKYYKYNNQQNHAQHQTLLEMKANTMEVSRRGEGFGSIFFSIALASFWEKVIALPEIPNKQNKSLI